MTRHGLFFDSPAPCLPNRGTWTHFTEVYLLLPRVFPPTSISFTPWSYIMTVILDFNSSVSSMYVLWVVDYVCGIRSLACGRREQTQWVSPTLDYRFSVLRTWSYIFTPSHIYGEGWYVPSGAHTSIWPNRICRWPCFPCVHNLCVRYCMTKCGQTQLTMVNKYEYDRDKWRMLACSKCSDRLGKFIRVYQPRLLLLG